MRFCAVEENDARSRMIGWNRRLGGENSRRHSRRSGSDNRNFALLFHGAILAGRAGRGGSWDRFAKIVFSVQFSVFSTLLKTEH